MHRAAATLILAACAAILGLACEEEEETAAGGEAACADLLIQAPCLDCLEASCCEEVRDCMADATDGGCAACIAGDADACTGSEIAVQLYACLVGSCEGTCGEGAPGPACDAPADRPSGGACVAIEGDAACNPVTNEGCDGAAGEACDYDSKRFHCFAPPNERALCEPCGGAEGNCGAGLSCFQQVTIGTGGVTVQGTCARTCCDDGDCGGGTCSARVTAEGSTVGVCIERGEGE